MINYFDFIKYSRHANVVEIAFFHWLFSFINQPEQDEELTSCAMGILDDLFLEKRPERYTSYESTRSHADDFTVLIVNQTHAIVLLLLAPAHLAATKKPAYMDAISDAYAYSLKIGENRSLDFSIPTENVLRYRWQSINQRFYYPDNENIFPPVSYRDILPKLQACKSTNPIFLEYLSMLSHRANQENSYETSPVNQWTVDSALGYWRHLKSQRAYCYWEASDTLEMARFFWIPDPCAQVVSFSKSLVYAEHQLCLVVSATIGQSEPRLLVHLFEAFSKALGERGLPVKRRRFLSLQDTPIFEVSITPQSLVDTIHVVEMEQNDILEGLQRVEGLEAMIAYLQNR